MAARPLRTLALGAALLAVFVLAAFAIPATPLRVEQRWSAWMADLRSQFLDHLALVFDALGHGVGRGLLLAAPAVVLVVWRWWALLAAFAIAEAVAPLASSATKALVDRPRPPGALLSPHGASFPSGHATFAGVTTAAFVLAFTAAGARRRVWWALAASATAGMVWSRTYLQVHWLLDAIAGAFLGVGVALVVFGVLALAAGPDGAGARAMPRDSPWAWPARRYWVTTPGERR